MRITPLDIRKQEFKKSMRGLDTEEVHAFLSTVADEYEAVLLDNKQLRERILELDEKIQEYRHMEKTLRDTLMTAERVLAEARENARKEADLILKDAEIKAQQAAENTRRQTADLRREVVELHKEKEAFLARFKGLAEAQLQFIENHRTDFEDLDRRLLGQAPKPQAARRPAEAEPQAPAAPTAPRPTAAAGPPARQVEEERDEWRDYEPPSFASERAAGAAPQARPADPADHGMPRGADLDSDDVDELLEPLAAVQDEIAAADEEAQRRQAAREAGSQPAQGAASGTERSREVAWNMESFTRGLTDL